MINPRYNGWAELTLDSGAYVGQAWVEGLLVGSRVMVDGHRYEVTGVRSIGNHLPSCLIVKAVLSTDTRLPYYPTNI